MVERNESNEDWVGIDFGSAFSAGALYSENKRDGNNIIDLDEREFSSVDNLNRRELR